MLVQRERPARFFGYVVVAFVLTEFWQPGLNRIEQVRSFFGVHKVIETADGGFRLLVHGNTIHGAQRLLDDGAVSAGRPDPLTYYYFGGPISEAIAATRNRLGRLDQVAAVGLGTGSLACHRLPREQWTFFEIDPQVIRIARDPKLFRFISDCAPDMPVVLGDARLTLAASSARYDLIVLDAFSSDAIPVHLLTREAMAGYLSHLSPRGVIVIHISNRHMDLSDVIAATGAKAGLVAYGKTDDQATAFLQDFRANARVVALAHSVDDLGDLPRQSGWRRLSAEKGMAVWTDDYSDILSAILRTKFGN
jgi:spermidine synthase